MFQYSIRDFSYYFYKNVAVSGSCQWTSVSPACFLDHLIRHVHQYDTLSDWIPYTFCHIQYDNIQWLDPIHLLSQQQSCMPSGVTAGHTNWQLSLGNSSRWGVWVLYSLQVWQEYCTCW